MPRKFADRERYNLLHFIRLQRKETAFSDPKYDSKRRGQSRKAAVLPTAAFKGLFQDNFSSPFLKTVDITRVSKSSVSTSAPIRTGRLWSPCFYSKEFAQDSNP